MTKEANLFSVSELRNPDHRSKVLLEIKPNLNMLERD